MTHDQLVGSAVILADTTILLAICCHRLWRILVTEGVAEGIGSDSASQTGYVSSPEDTLRELILYPGEWRVVDQL